MYGQLASEAYELPDQPSAIGWPASVFSRSRSCPNQDRGNDMGVSLRDNNHFKRGEHSANDTAITRSATPDCARWLANFFRATSAKKIANDAGINLRAAENVKQGRNGLTMAHLENLCKSNADFRAAWYAERCGGILEGEPEMVAALSKAINAIVRGKP